MTLNSLDEGQCPRKTVPSRIPGQPAGDREALAQLHAVALREASRLERARRGRVHPCPTGVASLAALLKTAPLNNYTIRDTTTKQIPMIADAIDEPEHGDVVHLLDVLSPEEGRFYRSESNVVETEGKSLVISQELEQQYGFIGGTMEEYTAYWHRPLPPQMWQFATREAVKTIAGFSVVRKKDPTRQRKLLMQCAANYWWCDPRRRENHGMLGGTALARMHVETDCLAASSFDESNAFTSVLTPPWMWGWCAAPPLPAHRIWNQLPLDLQARVSGDTMIYPLYCRLAMGSSHSVHLLMNINLTVVGRALCDTYRPKAIGGSGTSTSAGMAHSPQAQDVMEDQEFVTPDKALAESADTADDLWHAKQQADKASASMLSLDEFVEKVRALRNLAHRTFVVLNLFAGPRRRGDIEDWTTRLCAKAGLCLLFCSVDLLVDSRWDLAAPETLASLMMLCEEGLIDIVLGGPPCSTWSKLRFLPGGPPPLRLRGEHVWGLPNLTASQKARVREGNVLMVNFLALAEAVSSRGGGHLLEHPADPGGDPYPSIWSTEELLGLEARTLAVRLLIHQCMFGGRARKDTFLSGTLDGLLRDPILCDRSHSHSAYIGGCVNGEFKSRELATYPELLCKFIAMLIVNTIWRMYRDDSGPTGAIRLGEPCPRLSHWSTRAGPLQEVGVSIVNELATKHEGVVIEKDQGALYVHVDDGLCLSAGENPRLGTEVLTSCPDADAGRQADGCMEFCANSLERVGFHVTGRESDAVLSKIIGYEVVRHPAALRIPAERAALLQDALLFLVSCAFVSANTLRSVLGTWIWAALLKREALSIPYYIFDFCNRCEGQRVRWWPRVRDEVRAMAHVIPHLTAEVGSPLSDTVFATDAMGAAHDAGGFGIVAADLPHSTVVDCYRRAHKPGRTVVKLSNEFGGENHPETPFARRVPFSRLPREVFDSSRTTWHEVAAGRWRYADPIALGEGCAVVKISRALSANASAHRTKILSLQDILVTAGSMAKGRSPAATINYLCRQKAANTLGGRISMVLPWTETSLMPADSLSRYGFSGDGAPPVGRLSDGEDSTREPRSLQKSSAPFRRVLGGA